MVLACIVVFCTTYALILPAITLEKSACEKTEHTHTADCYTHAAGSSREAPVCSAERLGIHQHTEDCYNEEGKLSCGLADFVVHQHDSACYDEEGTLWCPLPEVEAHTHSDGCYAKRAEEDIGIEESDTEGVSDAESPESVVAFMEKAEGMSDAGSPESTAADTEEPESLSDAESMESTVVRTEEPEGVSDTESPESAAADTNEPKGLADEEAAGIPETDMTEPGELICDLAETDDHRHGPECYGFKEEPACGKEEVILHEHKEDCCDEDGNLVCGMLQVLEHQHTADCFQTVEEEADTETLNCQQEEHIHDQSCFPESAADAEPEEERAAMDPDALSVPEDAAAVAGRSADEEGKMWGYKEDGSIWWNFFEIEENTPYIIAGFQGNNLMADDTCQKGGYDYLKAIPKEDVTNYADYQRWYFEKKEDGTYYVYYLKDSADGSGKNLYLRFAGAGFEEWNKPTQQIVLTEEKSQATAFTVAKCTGTEYPNHLKLSVTIEGKTYYVNSYYGDKPKADNKTTHWLGYPEVSEGSYLKVYEYGKTPIETANRLETVVSGNTVMNFFDYWTSPDGAGANDGIDHMDGGINAGHNFKFYKNSAKYDSKWGTMNVLQGQAVINSGIVKETLGDNGYPVFSGDSVITGGAAESLDYLFDPEKGHSGKQSYRNIGGLLRVNDEGYYYFDSRETMAEFRQQESAIAVYDKPGVQRSGSGQTSSFGQFFPMNRAPEVMTKTSTADVMNHYLGLTITTRFIQKHGGCSDIEGKTPTTFSFAGDDDVWIFIDGVLVADLGGAHASVSVDINFQNGDILINGTKKTTLRDAYKAAGAEKKTSWRTSGSTNTYDDNTTHTLKFFYLERGNWDSNLYLRYNLTEIPKTAIYKVNQYGDVVPGATFAVYAANENYQMLSEKNGSVVEVEDSKYDDAGNIVDGSGKKASALYKGTTNEKGEMIFVDKDGMPYSLTELENLFGSNFILREIKVPEGYRVVTEDVYLQIWRGANQTILKCDNTMESGSRAASTLQVTATDTLHILRGYEGNVVAQGSTSIPYYNEADSSILGTLFAVVFKYTGDIGEDGNINPQDINNEEKWTPVYGSDEAGYNLIDMKDKDFLTAALEAARAAEGYGDVAFKLSSSSTMQLTLENLPGHVTTYYRMLGDEQKGQARYTIGYYWTDQASLETATKENTYRVNAFATKLSENVYYSGFERVFGANIQVPNLINKIYVQKMDEKDNRINGATFALYRVKEEGEIKYQLPDGSYAALTEKAEVKTDGKITDDGKTFLPLQTGITRSYEDKIHVGTTEFSNLEEGQYIIKEVNAPPGYKLNTADVMVLVTEDTIYANAGTEEDGVTVGRGPGYVVSTLDQFASEGQIDNTLSWIYAQMQISGVSTSFADVEDESKIAGYLKKNNSGETTNEPQERATTYLRYDAGKEGTAFNYVPNEDRKEETGAVGATGTRRLFTTVGWPYYEIYQDYEYGKTKKSPMANYDDWSGKNLMHLYSRSTYIRVTDIPETTLTVKKVDMMNRDTVLSGAQFRLYRMTEKETTEEETAEGETAGENTAETQIREYYTREQTDQGSKVKWVTDAAKAMVVTTGDDGLSEESFTKLTDGTYYLEEIKPPTGYQVPPISVPLTIDLAQIHLSAAEEASGHSLEKELENNLYIYTITVPNSTGYELPATGGAGIQWYTFSGLALMAGALGYDIYRRRRWEKKVS